MLRECHLLSLMGIETIYVIFERLDRALVNPSWINTFKDAKLHSYPIFGSDHSLIFLSSNEVLKNKRYGQFQFEAVWLHHPDFKTFVNDSWMW